LLSEPTNDRIQLLINNDPRNPQVTFGRVLFDHSVRAGGTSVDIGGINREMKADEIVMYTPEFGATTLTGGDVDEVVVLRGKIASSAVAQGNSVIPRDGYVLAAKGSAREKLRALIDEHYPVVLTRKTDRIPAGVTGLAKQPNQWDIIAGVPSLISNGSVNITWEREKSSRAFVETRHPRTAIAKLKDGKVLMITVDGRTEQSAGIGLKDLAEYLLSLGAVDAMNLDGGGSTTMYLDGKVVNHPSDKEGERKVSDAIIVTARRTSAPRKRR
jgi:hypothetical protein